MTQTPDLIGKQLGSYIVLSLIGSGGMACVYRGFDQNLQRPVAIKVLSPAAAAQPGLAERFRQEALLIAGLRHPHIVQVYNFGQQDDHTYMVQELLTGLTLAQYLHNLGSHGQLLGRQDILSVIAQLASALDAAHAAGIVHRDVKPANALWNAAGSLVLTDFGVARHILAEQSQEQTGLIIGTPDYLSPEQARGYPGTPASDIYALGVVLYELITGWVPFRGETRDEVLQHHRESPPPPLHPLRSDILPAVEKVIQRALAKDPAVRFSSAGELARVLKRAWPPIYGRATRILPIEHYHLVMHGWEQTPELHHTTTGADSPVPDNIHTRTTIISANPLSQAAQSESTPIEQPALQGITHPMAVSRQPSGNWFTLMLSLLVVLILLGGVVSALREDYHAIVHIPDTVDLVAPTAVPTAQVLTELILPTLTPTSIYIEPIVADTAVVQSPPARTIAEPVALVATTTPDPTTVALLATTLAEPATATDHFSQLRILIEADSNEGWARIDRDAWLNRLNDIQRAVETGDNQRAAAWLQEMRQTLLHTASNGTLSREVVERVVTDIERLASSNGIALPPLSTPVVDDG